MKTFAKFVAALLVIGALAAMLTYAAFYALYAVIILSLFYQGLLFFIIGAMFTGFVAWITLKIFGRHKVYSIKRWL